MLFSRWTSALRARHGRGVLTLIATMMGWLLGSPAFATSIVHVAADASRIVIRFDAPVEHASSTIGDGARQITVDLAGVAAHTPGVRGGFAAVHVDTGAAGDTRLVFDLASPAVVTDGALDDNGRSLTLSLVAADPATAMQASLAGPLDFFPFNLDLSGGKSRYKVSQAVPPAAKAPPLPHIEGDRSRPLVVIDPGHGGIDPGAINPENGLREKDVTLKIARAIRDELLARGRVRVALTRDDDRYLVLRERFGIARRLHADLFISIHCDSVGAGDASGASVYTLSEVASDKEAARLAARENKADVITGVDLGGAGADVSSILIDLTQRETMNNSADFARLLGREAAPLVPLKANFHRMASLMVLKAPDMPSVLFETGYISNPRDAAFLDSAEGRHRIAEGIERAVEVHFARRIAAR
ncbi:N-acetylmuramoyl-L-alanine amidase [Sphingomonas bacterium]|uniref:N-acetylmuramoyl-L-alanine amidase n=1 Tax=Sphingomonas bacterium TaxID=1895847 RepID=UPI001575F79C|nr:N-acetylmuramoyl-L-alanine amidase [Sphingomonas bacterium]